jgi:predicted signal transduction protein with EAL and GGDEF domain
MVLISVNRFRLINELYGHEFADKILLSITGELTDFVSKCKGLLGKESGGTFLLYCEHQEDYEALPKKLEEAVKKDAKDINVSFKIAVYPFVDPSLEKEIVIDRLSNTADTLTNDYGKNVAVYSQEAQTANLHKEELIAAFPEALKEGQFQLYFQPKYEIQGEKPRLTSAEVLIRWISPKFGFVSPGDFIPLFEENGLIGKLDAYILKKGAEYMRSWKEKYGFYVPLSLNLSESTSTALISSRKSSDTSIPTVSLGISITSKSPNPPSSRTPTKSFPSSTVSAMPASRSRSMISAADILLSGPLRICLLTC